VDVSKPQLDPAFNAEIRRVLSERDAYCPRCKYNLSGINGPRCPECGKNIREILRIADTTPWRLPHVRRRMILLMLARNAAMAAIIAGSIVCIGWAAWVLVLRGNV
jgi:tRNA(Ile2) C34 agmatinyltransferase TiaS